MTYRELIEESISRASGYGEWRRGTCYVCEVREGSPDRKRSFGYNTETRYYICHRCGVKGYEKGAAPVRREEKQEKAKFSEPEGYNRLASPDYSTAMCTEDARRYLLSRGVGPKTWEEVGIGVAMDGDLAGRIIVPILGTDGEWLGYQARVWTAKTSGLKYRNATGMDRHTTMFDMGALHTPHEDPIMVVEGTFDALPYWPLAVAVLGKPSRGQLEMLYKTERDVCFCLDGDAWRDGYTAAMKLFARGKKNVGYVRLPPGEDPNTVDIDGLKEMARKSIGRLV